MRLRTVCYFEWLVYIDRKCQLFSQCEWRSGRVRKWIERVQTHFFFIDILLEWETIRNLSSHNTTHVKSVIAKATHKDDVFSQICLKVKRNPTITIELKARYRCAVQNKWFWCFGVDGLLFCFKKWCLWSKTNSLSTYHGEFKCATKILCVLVD